MLAHPLPADAVQQLEAWRAGRGASHGSEAGTHAVHYAPASWTGIQPWPGQLADRTQPGLTALSRDLVREVAQADSTSGEWMDTLVASYVWGQGRNGYGPHRLHTILQRTSLRTVLSRAVAELTVNGAVAAYRVMRGAIGGLGPAFFTKFLYFAGAGLPQVPGSRPLILDRCIARVLRAHAMRAGQEAGFEQPARLAAWLWSNGGWSAHRYGIYLQWLHCATGSLVHAASCSAAPDLLELALFYGGWDPAAAGSTALP
ncbi:hypothetical protein AB0H97_36365 [Streptomyces sp. NPDC050788]|jgi:hypothetical protein|uniref:8-oxoguanine DNA glycosylase OGG fold protein n=1 Tax=Streptomyces sp. NPDC050788 TaxID=3155041 RepID=UPI00344517CA